MELTAVLVVLGIVAAVAISRFSTGNASAVSEAEIFKSCLRYAQIRAMGDISTWGITFDNNTTYRLFTNNSSVTPLLPGIGSASRTMPDGVTLSVSGAVSGSGLGSIIFNYRGQPVASGGPGDTTNGKEYQKNDSSKWPAARSANTTVTFTKDAAVAVTVSQQTGFAQ